LIEIRIYIPRGSILNIGLTEIGIVLYIVEEVKLSVEFEYADGRVSESESGEAWG